MLLAWDCNRKRSKVVGVAASLRYTAMSLMYTKNCKVYQQMQNILAFLTRKKFLHKNALFIREVEVDFVFCLGTANSIVWDPSQNTLVSDSRRELSKVEIENATTIAAFGSALVLC